jgi:hypothetical protein
VKSFSLSGSMRKIESIKKIKRKLFGKRKTFFDEEILKMFLDNRNKIKRKISVLFSTEGLGEDKNLLLMMAI